jgi:hypothetical protein
MPTQHPDLPTFSRPPVFLSASVPLIDRHPVYFSTADQVAIRDAVIALATVVLPATGIVYGGHPAITPLVSKLAQQIGAAPDRVVLYQSAWFVTGPPSPLPATKTIVVPKATSRDDSLDRMRHDMIDSYRFQAGVFIGGMDGVEREFDLFRQTHPAAELFPLGSTGAAAAILLDQRPPPPGGWPRGLRDDPSYLTLFRRLLKL